MSISVIEQNSIGSFFRVCRSDGPLSGKLAQHITKAEKQFGAAEITDFASIPKMLSIIQQLPAHMAPILTTYT